MFPPAGDEEPTDAPDAVPRAALPRRDARERLESELGLGLAIGVGIQFPGLFGPVGLRIALHHQLVPVSDAHSRVQSASVLTLGLAY